MHPLKRVVVDIYTALGEVGRIQITIAVDISAGQACIAGTIGGSDYRHGMGRRRRRFWRNADGRIPADNGSINRREEESRGSTGRQQEIGGAAVEDGAGWSTGRRLFVVGIRRGDGYDQALLGSRAVVEGAEAGGVIGDPPGAAGAARQAPGIDQLRIGDGSDS